MAADSAAATVKDKRHRPIVVDMYGSCAASEASPWCRSREASTVGLELGSGYRMWDFGV